MFCIVMHFDREIHKLIVPATACVPDVCLLFAKGSNLLISFFLSFAFRDFSNTQVDSTDCACCYD